MIPAHLSRAPTPFHNETGPHPSDPTRGQGFRATRFFSRVPQIAEGLLILNAFCGFFFVRVLHVAVLTRDINHLQCTGVAH